MRSSGFFWRALDAARQVNLAEAGAGPAVAGAAGLTRRRLLSAMAASAALPAIGCKQILPAASAKTKVAIVGAGMAGLIALRDLRAAGIDAKIYEGRSRIGGRISTFRGGPIPADDGGQFINADHADMLALAKQYGLDLIDRSAFAGHSLAVFDGKVFGEADLARDLRDIAARIGEDAAALDQDYEAHAPALDAISVTQYLDRHHNSLPKPYARALLEATIRTEFGQDPGEASAMELIFNLPVVDGQHVRIIGSSDERYVLKGGSGTVVDAVAKPLMPHIELGKTLTAIEKSEGGVRLRFAGGATVEAERVIVTVPAPLLRTIDFGDLLPPLWKHYAAEIGNGRNEKLNAVYKARPWDKSLGRAGDLWPLQGGFAESWDATTVDGDTSLMTYFMGGAQCVASDKLDDKALRAAFEGQAAPAVPGLAEGPAGWQRRTHWGKDLYSRGAYSCFKPGQLTKYAGLFWLEEDGKPTRPSIAGPIVFAGEHLSDAWPGYMNGGAQTGRMAAQVVLKGAPAG
jgi:monoamine oxidase